MSSKHLVTPAPRAAKIITTRTDSVTNFTYTYMKFKRAGDYYAFRGPASAEFFDIEGPHTLNMCDKPYTVVFKKDDGDYHTKTNIGFNNSNYTENRSYGPFVFLAHEDNTSYHCIRIHRDWIPLESAMVDLADGESLDINLYHGWNCCVLQGNFAGNSVGSLLLVDNAIDLAATESVKLCVVRAKP